MAINNPEITAIDHSQDTNTAIEIVTSEPASGVLETNVVPGRLLGFYDASSGTVSLYVADRNGLRWLPVTFNG